MAVDALGSGGAGVLGLLGVSGADGSATATGQGAAGTRLVMQAPTLGEQTQKEGLLAAIPDTGSGTSGQSRYLEATLGSLRIDNRIQTEEADTLFDQLDQFGGLCVSGTSYGDGSGYSEGYIKMMLKRAGNKRLMDDADQNLTAERQEQQAQAVVDAAPKDAAGNPILIGTDVQAASGGSEGATVSPPVESPAVKGGTTEQEADTAAAGSDTAAAGPDTPAATLVGSDGAAPGAGGRDTPRLDIRV